MRKRPSADISLSIAASSIACRLDIDRVIALISGKDASFHEFFPAQ
jgi:hypothetical protein